ncbi:MAG: polysaccharide deacetylase family protein, partial [Rhizobiaceae bacterium]
VLGSLKRRGTEFVSLDEAVERIKTYDPKQLKEPFVAITLDDGYRDNLQYAVPVFRKYSAPYTIYLATGLVEGEAILWWEDLETVIASRHRFFMHSPKGRVEFDVSTDEKKRAVFEEMVEFLTSVPDEKEQRAIVSDLATQTGHDPVAHRKQQIMTWSEISELNNDPLCTFGAHTINHYAVARLEPDAARYEMEECARVMEYELGEWPHHFAFPYGYPAAAGPRDFELAREIGFQTACTTRHGVLYQEHGKHLHALPRISLNGLFQSSRYVDTLLSGLPTLLQNRGKKLNVS